MSGLTSVTAILHPPGAFKKAEGIVAEDGINHCNWNQ